MSEAVTNTVLNNINTVDNLLNDYQSIPNPPSPPPSIPQGEVDRILAQYYGSLYKYYYKYEPVASSDIKLLKKVVSILKNTIKLAENLKNDNLVQTLNQYLSNYENALSGLRSFVKVNPLVFQLLSTAYSNLAQIQNFPQLPQLPSNPSLTTLVQYYSELASYYQQVKEIAKENIQKINNAIANFQQAGANISKLTSVLSQYKEIYKEAPEFSQFYSALSEVYNFLAQYVNIPKAPKPPEIEKSQAIPLHNNPCFEELAQYYAELSSWFSENENNIKNNISVLSNAISTLKSAISIGQSLGVDVSSLQQSLECYCNALKQLESLNNPNYAQFYSALSNAYSCLAKFINLPDMPTPPDNPTAQQVAQYYAELSS